MLAIKQDKNLQLLNVHPSVTPNDVDLVRDPVTRRCPGFITPRESEQITLEHETGC